MNKNNIVLGLACGFFALAVLSLFMDISVQIISTLSICSLLFSVAQALQSFLNEREKENKALFEAIDQAGNMNIPKENMLFIQKYFSDFITDKKTKAFKIITDGLECLSIIILICGLVIPMPFLQNERTGTFCTIGSFSAIFVSIWLVAKVHIRLQKWNDVQLFSLMINQNRENDNTVIPEEKDNGQIENAQPE